MTVNQFTESLSSSTSSPISSLSGYTDNSTGVYTMYIDHSTNESVVPHYIHQWLDVYNRKKRKWYEAQIIDIDYVRQIMCIHYKSLPASYNEWIDNSSTDYIYNHNIIQLLHTHTTPAVWADHKYRYNNIQYQINDKVDVLDEYDNWCSGTIIDCDTYYSQYNIQYINYKYHIECKEWLNYTSYRIQPYDTQASTNTAHSNNNTIINAQHYHTSNKRSRHSHKNQSRSHQIGYTTTDDNELKFRHALNVRLHYDIIEQIPDGNCLFRSVSHQLYGTADHHQLVRHKCMEYIQCERNYFHNYISESFDEYITRMKQDGEWGDHVEIQAMSEIYDRTIEIYAYRDVPFKIFNANANINNVNHKVIRLSYHFASHYNSVVDTAQPINYLDVPGTIESCAILRSHLLNTTDNTPSHTNDNDIQQTDHIQLQSIIDSSREQFNLINQSEYDAAVTQSLNELNSDTDNALEAARTESLRDYDMQQQVEHAVALSLQQPCNTNKQSQSTSTSSTATGTNSNKTIQHSTSNLEEQNITRVLAESLQSQPKTQHTTEVLSEPIQRCMELGFTLDECVQAYSLFNDNTNNIDDITQNMSAYLFASI